MTQRRIALVAVVAAGLGGLIWFFFLRLEPDRLEVATASVSALPSSPAPGDPNYIKRDRREAGLPALAAITPLPVRNPADRSPLADLLLKPEQTGLQDLAIVLNLFDHYRAKFGGLPSGESNAHIVNALTGNNPFRLALIERSHPAINPRGELTDRWGTPFFFHLVSREAIEIRSAGPDRDMWTDDDLLTQSSSLRQTPGLGP